MDIHVNGYLSYALPFCSIKYILNIQVIIFFLLNIIVSWIYISVYINMFYIWSIIPNLLYLFYREYLLHYSYAI